VGQDEALRIQKILDDSAELIAQNVLARIARRREEFDSRHPAGSEKRRDAEARAWMRRPPRSYTAEEAYHQVVCPACGLDSWVLGVEYDREVTAERYEQDSESDFTLFHTVAVYYTSEAFSCDECGLKLDGSQEVEAADLHVEFEAEMEEEPDYGPDYGNE
jgi:hypothetical protein